MIETIKEWLVSVICAAMLVSVAENTAPPGELKKTVSLLGGLILLAVLVRPLNALDPGRILPETGAYSRSVEQLKEELETDRGDTLQTLIEQRTAAYISDKAAELGLECRVEVECRTGEDGIPWPFGVTVFGVTSRELQSWIHRELDIPEERQVYHGTET